MAQQYCKNAPNDLDLITEYGYYRVLQNPNAPSSRKYGTLHVYKPTNGWVVQDFTSIVDGEVWRRINDDGNWSKWSRIDNFGANTPAELASVVAGMYPRVIPDNDLSHITENGVYIAYSDTINKPSNYGVILFFKASSQYKVWVSINLIGGSSSGDVHISGDGKTWTKIH